MGSQALRGDSVATTSGMIFRKTKLKGSYLIELEPKSDDRGFLARSFCRKEFIQHGLNGKLVQTSISFNRRKGTLRGMHYQAAPHKEVKVVRCTRGAIYDVIVDIRRRSETFGQWISNVMTQENRRMLYIPEGFAHGFQTLADNTEILYYMSDYYAPSSSCGFRWNDPRFKIKWPEFKYRTLSQKDRVYPNFQA